jgi:hypothetical protein
VAPPPLTAPIPSNRLPIAFPSMLIVCPFIVFTLRHIISKQNNSLNNVVPWEHLSTKIFEFMLFINNYLTFSDIGMNA